MRRARLLAAAAAVFFVGVVVALFWTPADAADTGTTTDTTGTTPLTVTETVPDPSVVRQLRRARRRNRQLTRVLWHRPSTAEAITLACHTYGSCSTLWRRARCESRFDPTAQNPSGASGLFQFLPSTWARTPYASTSIWSPYANALAAGWMQAHGHGGEWACR